MIARVSSIVGLLAISGCAGLADTSYVLGSGDASYDALKAATETCKAKGGEVRPRKNYDPMQLSSYECAIGKAG